MPTQVPLSSLLQAIVPNISGDNSNQPFIRVAGQIQQNPAYLDPLKAQQLSASLNGPTAGAIQGGAIQTAANEGARLAASAIGSQAVPYTASDLQNLIDPNTGQQLPVGTRPADVTGRTFISSTDKQGLQEINAVQNLINQIKSASAAVNINSGSVGNRSPMQFLRGLKLNALGDPNAQFLNEGVRGLLGLVASGAAGVNRFNQEEIDALQKDFPTISDTKEVAQSKINRIQKIIDQKYHDLGVSSITDTQHQAPSPQQVALPAGNPGNGTPSQFDQSVQQAQPQPIAGGNPTIYGNLNASDPLGLFQ